MKWISHDNFFLRKPPGGEYHLISWDRGTNQIARKWLFTCAVYTNYRYPDKMHCSLWVRVEELLFVDFESFRRHPLPLVSHSPLHSAIGCPTTMSDIPTMHWSTKWSSTRGETFRVSSLTFLRLLRGLQPSPSPWKSATCNQCTSRVLFTRWLCRCLVKYSDFAANTCFCARPPFCFGWTRSQCLVLPCKGPGSEQD